MTGTASCRCNRCLFHPKGSMRTYFPADEVVAWFEEHAGKTGIPAEVAALKKVSEEDNPVVVIME